MKLKKILAVLSAGMTIAVCSAGNISSAVTPPASYDINKDGDVSIADVVVISQALNGQWKPTNISDIDANQNGIVDDLDRRAILACFVFENSLTTITMQ